MRVIIISHSDAMDFTPSDPQSIIFESTSNVGGTQCITYQIVGDDYKEIDEELTIIVEPQKQDDIISNPFPLIPITIRDDGDCKFLIHIIHQTLSPLQM